MKAKLLNLENEAVGEIDLDNEVFAVDFVREDIIKLVVDWQRAKAMAGTHQTKTVSQVSGTTKKPFKQKGTGNARQGSLRSVQMRGGGVSHGPVTRSHATKLPKKVRKLGLKHALSEKLAEGKLLIVDSLKLHESKTSNLIKLLNNFHGKSYFIVSGDEVDINFSLAVQNIPNTISVPQIGANVYDIIRHDYVLLSQEAVDALEKEVKVKSYKHYDLIRNPVITEKTNILSEQQNKFTFHVAGSAEKASIKMAVEKIFQVKVKKVNIMNVKGKRKRFKGVNGRQSDKKKAIVTLEKDYTIDFTGGIK